LNEQKMRIRVRPLQIRTPRALPGFRRSRRRGEASRPRSDASPRFYSLLLPPTFPVDRRR
jgi:hypothetical protein